MKIYLNVYHSISRQALLFFSDPTPTDLGYGLINAFWQLHSKFVVGRKMMIWLATNGSNKDGTNIRLIAKTLKNWGKPNYI